MSVQSEMQVHCDFEMYEAAIKKNQLLQKCIEKEINALKMRKAKETKNDEKNNTDEEIVNEDETKLKSAIYLNIDHVKLSEEINKIYENELENEQNSETSLHIRLWLMQNQHNCDAFYYAQNDPWVIIYFYILFYVFFLISCRLPWQRVHQVI